MRRKATQIIHWPSGPMAVCDEHARRFLDLGKNIQNRAHATKIKHNENCRNCERNANEKE